MDNISSIIQPQDAPTSQDTSLFSSDPLWLPHPLEDDDLHAMIADKSHQLRFKRSKSSSCIDFRSSKDDENSSADHQPSKTKRIVHRDVERQRRQDMASLYSSLRSLLPLEYLKGKRSISDHIHEAVNYIKDMEEKIQKMRDKINELKGLDNSGLDSSVEAMGGSELRVEQCCVGVEVIINTSTRQQWSSLSRVVTVLTEEGLTVVSCVSTKVNQRMLHSIKSEVGEGSSIELSEMQQKLINCLGWVAQVVKA